MRIWRISNYADLSGLGGTYSSGRWNHLGTRIVYCAEHPALSMLEMLVHFDPEDMPERYQLLEIEVPDEIELVTIDLPKNWKDDPVISRDCFARFCARATSPVLGVPSAIMPHCNNILINPLHPDHAKLKIISAMEHPMDRRFLT